MHKSPTEFCCLLVFISLIAVSAFGQRMHAPTWSKSDRTVDRNAPEPIILSADFQFSHPMTVMNPVELAELRRRVQENIEPQASYFQTMLVEAQKMLSAEPKPPEGTLTIMGGYQKGTNLNDVRKLFSRDGKAAYRAALVYAISGDTAHADHAVRFLNAWDQASPSFNGMDAGLQLGSYLPGLLFAADLLHDYQGWKKDDRSKFESWWREKVLPHAEHVTYLRNNWGDAGLQGIMAAAVVFEDRELLARWNPSSLTLLKSE